MNKLIGELRRRSIFRVAAAYLVAGWLIMQVVATIGTAAGLPDWTDSFALILLLTGFPIVLFIAWAFELSPDGLKQTEASGAAAGFKPLGPSDWVLMAGVAVVLAVAAVQALTGSPAAPGPQIADRPGGTTETRSRIAGALDTSIAVLPFADLSADGDKQYFGDGIAEEILNVLARIEVLDVTSRTSAFAFRSDSALSIPDIAEILGVRHVLEGSIRTAGGNIRVTAQLIDAASDTHVWSETYDRALTAENVFAIQDEIASAITAQLTQRLGITVTATAGPAAGGTSEVSAYEAYLQGRTLFINRNYDNLRLSITALEQAVELDPDFGRAWGVLAMAYVVAPQWGLVDRPYYTLAEDAANRAFAIDPDNADAFTAMGVLHEFADVADYNAAIEAFQNAIASDPQATTAHLWLGQAWRNLGFFDRAQASVEACLAIDPDYPVCLFTRAEADLFQGDYPTATAHLLAVYATSHTEAYPTMLGGAAAQGDEVLLTLMLREMADLISPNARWMVHDLRRALSDEVYDRAAALDRFEARLAGFEGQGAYGDPYLISAYLLAFRAYHRLPELGSGQAPWWWAPGYPGLASSAARHRMLEVANVHPYWRQHGFPPQCRPLGADDFECD
ncbi:tetratricopeptide repeat protein [Maricaulis sp. CAU 1757]